MRWSIVTGGVIPLLALLAMPARVLAAPCQRGVASAAYIGASDMRAIASAAKTLPTAAGPVKVDVGSAVPTSVRRAPVPAAVAKVLPQYKGYSAFKAGADLMIVDARGILSYIMPLHGTATPANCP